MLTSAADTPDSVVFIVLGLALLACCWFALKKWAESSTEAREWYEWWDPRVAAMKMWIQSAPATFTYIAAWTATSIVVQTAPLKLADALSTANSTNLWHMINDPVRVLISSGLLVADNGFAYGLYVVVYVLIVARLEHRIGTVRVIIVGVGAHVAGTLLTVATEATLIQLHIAPPSLILTTDVGVSYVMAGACAGYLFFISRTWRWWYVAALFVTLVLPVLLFHTIWNFGHLYAAVSGLLLTWVIRRWGVRERMSWRQVVQSTPPRSLPTWGRPLTADDGRS